MEEIKVTLTAAPKDKPADESKLGFGKCFTDHMFVMDYTVGKGWHDPRIVPYGPISLDPSASVFHYGQEVFEGMKAYRTADGSIQLFRPEENYKRMNHSNERLCIPEIDVDFCIKATKKLVEVEKDWTASQTVSINAAWFTVSSLSLAKTGVMPVSYTHLDVYKRQGYNQSCFISYVSSIGFYRITIERSPVLIHHA